MSGVLPLRPVRGSSLFECFTKWLPNGLPESTTGNGEELVKEGPGEHKEMDATKDIILVLMLPFEGYCQKDYHLREIFKRFSFGP